MCPRRGDRGVPDNDDTVDTPWAWQAACRLEASVESGFIPEDFKFLILSHRTPARGRRDGRGSIRDRGGEHAPSSDAPRVWSVGRGKRRREGGPEGARGMGICKGGRKTVTSRQKGSEVRMDSGWTARRAARGLSTTPSSSPVAPAIFFPDVNKSPLAPSSPSSAMAASCSD